MLVITAKGKLIEIPQKAVDEYKLDRVWYGEKLDDGTKLFSITYCFNPNKSPIVLGRYAEPHAGELLDHLKYYLRTGKMDRYFMPPDDDYYDG